MAFSKVVLLLWIASVASAASSAERTSAKRAVDNYNYQSPGLAYAESDANERTVVETISSQGRYLPPNGEEENQSAPINVSYEAYEHDEEAPAAPSSSTAAPAATNPPATTTVQRKRPSGGLGAFKYYGGKGASKSSSNAAANSVSAVPTPARPIQVQVQDEPRPSTYRPPVKNIGFNYPSPKNPLKPSKKEQKLSDSRGEESSVGGYEYEPASFLSGVDSFSSGNVGQFTPGPFISSAHSPAPGGMGMGLSYMRQSSPFFSYHVMLD